MNETNILQAHDDVVRADYTKTAGRGGISNTNTQPPKPAQQKRTNAGANNNNTQTPKQQAPKKPQTTTTPKPEPPTQKAPDGTDVKCLTCYAQHKNSRNRWFGSHGDDTCWVLNKDFKPAKFRQQRMNGEEVEDEAPINNGDSNTYLDDALAQSGTIYDYSQRRVTCVSTKTEYNGLSNKGFTEPDTDAKDVQVAVMKKVLSEEQVEAKKEAKAAKKERQRTKKRDEEEQREK